MAKKLRKFEADIVIAGGGPGGCAIARDLSKMGKRVIMVERGGYFKRYLGTPLVFARHLERAGKYRTIEGEPVYAGVGVGGGTLVFYASVTEPDHDMWQKYGIDITEETKEARKECWANKVPDSLLAPPAKRLMTAARELGYPWESQEKMIDFNKCRMECNLCGLGCPRGAKWTGMEFAKEALKNGAKILTGVTVRDVIVENGLAGGVRAKGSDGTEYEINAKVVVCSAGGVGTARILKRSGIYEAGSWLSTDPAFATTGYTREITHRNHDNAMNVGWHDKENGVFFVNNTMSRRLTYSKAITSTHKRRDLRNMLRWGRALSIVAVVGDEPEGRVLLEDGKVSKRYTKRDMYRVEYARVLNEKILIKAGCDPATISHDELTHTHLKGTVKLGTLLDSNLETPIKNLYCCDLSVIPDLSMEPTLTLMALARRLSGRLEAILAAS